MKKYNDGNNTSTECSLDCMYANFDAEGMEEMEDEIEFLTFLLENAETEEEETEIKLQLLDIALAAEIKKNVNM